MKILSKISVVMLLLGCGAKGGENTYDNFEYTAGPDYSVCYNDTYSEPIDLNDNAYPKGGEWSVEKLDIEINDSKVDIDLLPPGNHRFKYVVENNGKKYSDFLVINVLNPRFEEIENDTLRASVDELGKEINEGRFNSVGLGYFDEDLKMNEYQILRFTVTDSEGCQKDIERVVFVVDEYDKS